MADEAEGGSQLTALGKFISLLLILGLVGAGVYVVMRPQAAPPAPPGPTPAKPGGTGVGTPGAPQDAQAEAHDTASVTTKSEYKYVAAERLPPVKGASKYNWNEHEKVFRFSYNVWAGWLPVIAANGGAKPNAESVFFKKYGFKVEMVLMDDPVHARDAFAAGEVHSLWGTVDMLVLFAPELMRDPRTAPRVVQQIDWSSGGDGIVVRDHIKSVKDLKGKTIALAQNSPSQYYLTSLLLSAGLKPADVNPKYTGDAFMAAAAFVADKSIDACVSWAPDIYSISEKVKKTKILSNTKDANRLIADVYAIRADFMRDHPDVVEGLVAGIFEGMDIVNKNSAQPCAWLADAFGFKPDEVTGMLGDFHMTNFAENMQFFLNASNPTNFERTWKNAGHVYRTLGSINAPEPFDKVMDFTIVQQLQKKGAFPAQQEESKSTFTAVTYKQISAEAPILTQTIRINFYPNSAHPMEPARDELGNILQGKLYDPNAEATLDRVGQLAGQFERAVILIEGHTDASMKGRVPPQAVKDLSQARAEAIKRLLIQKNKFDPNKFVIEGKGWDRPFDENDPGNHALNRRVEISVYSPEQK